MTKRWLEKRLPMAGLLLLASLALMTPASARDDDDEDSHHSGRGHSDRDRDSNKFEIRTLSTAPT